MAKIWLGAFWKPAPEGRTPGHLPAAMLAPIAALGLITITIGLMAQPLVTYSQQVAAELSDRERYIGLVLNPGDDGGTWLADETQAPSIHDITDRARKPSYEESR